MFTYILLLRSYFFICHCWLFIRFFFFFAQLHLIAFSLRLFSILFFSLVVPCFTVTHAYMRCTRIIHTVHCTHMHLCVYFVLHFFIGVGGVVLFAFFISLFFSFEIIGHDARVCAMHSMIASLTNIVVMINPRFLFYKLIFFFFFLFFG